MKSEYGLFMATFYLNTAIIKSKMICLNKNMLKYMFIFKFNLENKQTDYVNLSILSNYRGKIFL